MAELFVLDRPSTLPADDFEPALSSPSDTTTSAAVPLALRQLVQQVAREHPAPVTRPLASNGAPEILFDAVYDGVRCILVRVCAEPAPEPVVLSPRELEIARMVARGYANKTIAAVLEISSWTVSTYLRRIFAKLGVSSRAAMVTRLHEENIGSEWLSPWR